MQHIVMFSYGRHSWAAAKRVVQRHGTENTTLLFADTRYEDEDTYAWGQAAARNVGAELVVLKDGRDIWEVFRDERYLGNTRLDPCSKILKREACRKWLEKWHTPTSCILYVGIHASEEDRFRTIRARWLPWKVEAPLCDPPILGEQEIKDWALKEGLWEQKLYQLGFPHANCGGRCVKMGQAGWASLLRAMPERYREEEAKEEALRQYLGKDVSILRDRTGGTVKPLTLRAFRERLEKGKDYDATDFGGCNCFATPAGDEP